jgi:hypothetical protein
MLQLEFPGTELPQLLVCENSPRLVPASAMVKGSAAPPPFVTVSESGALTEFFATLPNANVVGESVYEAKVPVPLSVAICAPAPPPAFTFSVPDFTPLEVGANITLMVQADPPGTEVPQVLVCENNARFAPASATLVIGKAALLSFVTVTDNGALAEFVAMLPNANAVGDNV